MSTRVREPRLGVVADGAVPPVGPPPGLYVANPFARLNQPMPTDRLRGWLATLTLAVIAAIVRLQDLGSPTEGGAPVFDEKHYVPQAWQMLRNGGVEDNPGYELTVHPPLGKEFIAIGEWLFGYNGVGWRFASAVAGVAMVVLIVRIARRLTRSTLLGSIAGVLLICDGLSHVQSRMGMLDVFMATLLLGAFATLMADRDQVRDRLATAADQGWATESRFGPRLGFRWWRFATGILIGLAAGVKWDAAYWAALFGILCMLYSATARRAAGVQRPWLGALARDLAPALWAMLVIPVLAYLATWWGWFASETGIERHVAGGYSYNGEGIGAHSNWWFIPDALRSLWYYSGNVLDFHVHLTTKSAGQHPWESKPWSWPMSLRPMLYSYDSAATGCGAPKCVAGTMIIGTPAMWWLSLPTLGWAVWRTIGRFDWRYATVLITYLAGVLPWMIDESRQMFFFYMTPVVPFLVLGITLVLGEILGRATAGYERRRTGLLVVACYVGLVVANFVWLWPILNGDSISVEHWNAEMWLPSWR